MLEVDADDDVTVDLGTSVGVVAEVVPSDGFGVPVGGMVLRRVVACVIGS